MPWFVPVVALAKSTVVRYVVAGTVTYFVGSEIVGQIDEDLGENIDDLEKTLIDSGGTIVAGAAERVGGLTLAFVRGFGSALIDGIDDAYDAVREKLRGKEDDVIAGFTVGLMALLTIVYVYNSVKNSSDVV